MICRILPPPHHRHENSHQGVHDFIGYRITPSYAIILFAASLFTLFILLLYFLQQSDISIRPNRFIIAFADSALILLPYWFIPKKWRPTIMIPIWGFAIFGFCSCLYFRFFADIMPFGVLLWWNNVDSEVLLNIPQLLKTKDFIFLLMPLIVTFLTIRYKKELVTYEFKKKTKWIYMIGTLLLFCAGQLRVIRNEAISTDGRIEEIDSTFKIKRLYLLPRWSYCGEVADIGFLLHTFKTTVHEVFGAINNGRLSKSDKAIIEKYLDGNNDNFFVSDSIDNSGKNVILVIVESLNSWVIGKEYGSNAVSYTPVLDSLIQDSNTIYNLDIESQIKTGQSSDGQLMYNTGLLPLINDVVVGPFVNNRFPSLAEQLDKSLKFEVIYETPRLWNHDESSKSYHYDRLYSHTDIMEFAERHGWEGKDGLLFNFAFDKIKNSKEPYLCEITTLSMHAPFIDERGDYLSSIDSIQGISEVHRSYLRCVNYFDTQLGIFLNKLKDSGIYDNTLIFIASDHDLTFHDQGIPEGKSKIAFFALNTSIKKKINRQAEQIDIYPTILDLCTVKNSKFGWRGIGASMLSDSLRLTTENDWVVNEKIIKSNYFKHIEEKQ